MGRAVKIANETTRIKSVVKWFIPRSVPASQSQGNAEANKVVSINSLSIQPDLIRPLCSFYSLLSKNYHYFFLLFEMYLQQYNSTDFIR